VRVIDGPELTIWSSIFIILDSSASHYLSPAERFIKNSEHPDQLFQQQRMQSLTLLAKVLPTLALLSTLLSIIVSIGVNEMNILLATAGTGSVIFPALPGCWLLAYFLYRYYTDAATEAL